MKNKIKEHFTNNLLVILKSLWIGATMTVPGVSGGTMAVIVGIYEELLHAINNVLRKPSKYIPFLFLFTLGAGTGFLIFAKGITYLLENNNTEGITRFFFCGVVAGGTVLLVKKTELRKISICNILALLSGAVIVVGLGAIPAQGILAGKGIVSVFVQLIIGIIVAIALILPGISVTHILYLFGLYEQVINCIYNKEVFILLPLFLGVVIGIFLFSWLIERMLRKYTTNIYLIILGFVAVSVWSLMPKNINDFSLIGVLAFVAGFLLAYMATKYEK